MRRFSKVVLWGGLVCALAVGSAPAQLINEIIRGAANQVSSDIFNCRRGNNPCDLGYRMYSSVDPSEINGPSNPVDGIPRYLDAKKQYRADAQTTANFAVSGGSGGGNEWYVVWDGQTDGGTSDHAGWYGGQSQKVTFGEIGNSLSFNCLPVIAQEACFRGLSPLNGSNDTTRADGSALNHDGGMSPIPIAQIADNGLTAITLDWEFTANSTENDGAGSAIDTQSIWAVGNPTSFPTDGDLGANAVLVATVPRAQTSVILDRATLDSTLGLLRTTTYGFATTLGYQGGLGSNFSGNSARTGECIGGTTEPGDAPAFIDIEQVCVEFRTDGAGTQFLVVTFYMAQSPVGVNQRKYELDLGSRNADLIAFPASASLNRTGEAVVLRATANFDAGDIVGNSPSPDNALSRVTMVVAAAGVVSGNGGQTSINVSGRVKQPGVRDEFDLGTITFP